MKAKSLLTFSIILSSLFFFCRCTPTPNQEFISSTDEMLTRSNWSIDYFYDSQNVTLDFGGFKLLFSGTGAAIAQKNNESIQGNWNISKDRDNHEIMAINFTTSDITISKFNNQWKLTGKTNSVLEFEESSHSSNTVLLRIKKQ
ncbi:MAG: hypothetical protein JST10_13985 [Bacteroidetes bacterium]|nr:hypothetical protein [Bacteroidota bacterium]MBS1633672.1 hypothetical protein [Bacteroidota bacterium]